MRVWERLKREKNIFRGQFRPRGLIRKGTFVRPRKITKGPWLERRVWRIRILFDL